MSLEPFTTIFAAQYKKILLNPERTQRKLLQKILASSTGSPVAKALGLRGDESFEEFLQILPRDYAFYQPFVQRVFDGDPNAFGRNAIVVFGETSGSMGQPKLIPQTAESLRRFKNFVQTVLIFQLLDGKSYIPNFTKWLLVSASSHVRKERGMPVGFISGLMYQGTQTKRKNFILPSPRIAGIQDWGERIHQSVKEGMGQRVGTLFGVPAYLMRFFYEASLQSQGKPLGEVWPLLRAVYYSGTSADLYREEMERILNRQLIIRGLYTATEGAFGAELDANANGQIRLFPDMAVFSFRDTSEMGDRLLAMWELRVGQKYEIIVTTVAGLCQYRIGDVVEVTQVNPLLIRIVGRVGEEINLATEKLSSKQAQAVMAKVHDRFGLHGEHFLVLPDPANSRRHLWLVQSSSLKAEETAKAIDQALATINPSYAALRSRDAVLLMPRVLFIKSETFNGYVSLGFDRRGQFKFRHIFPDAETLLHTPGLEHLSSQLMSENN